MNKYILSLSLLAVPFGASAMDANNSSSSPGAQTPSQSVVGAMQNTAQLSPAFVADRFSNPDELLPYLKDLIAYTVASYGVGDHYSASIKSEYSPDEQPSFWASVRALRMGETYSAQLFFGGKTSDFRDPRRCFEIIRALYQERCRALHLPNTSL